MDLVECLDGIGVESLKLFVVKSGKRKGLKVKKRCGFGEWPWKDEMLEGDGEADFRVQPTVRDDGDVVVGWNGLENGDSDSDIVLVLCVSLPQDKVVVEEYDLAINILNKDDEGFSGAMNLFVPPEVRHDGKIDAEERTGDRLDLSLQPKNFRQ